MKIPRAIVLTITLSLVQIASSAKDGQAQVRKVTPVDFSEVRIHDQFWTPVLDRHKHVTLAVCIDQIENQTGRIRNFENAAGKSGQHQGIFFDDSDVYKALEGMAYSLINNPDPALEAKCEEWIGKFAAAQEKDGYLNTYYTLTGLENRWTDMDKHEMYCAGHMIEAAVACYKATGNRKLLEVSIGFADHMMTVFGPGKRHWVPGHEEIELALVKLSLVTGETKYLDFAKWLLDQRGHGYGGRYADGELQRWNPVYYQDNIPVKEITDICGHAVRAMYLYCGMADVAIQKHDQEYIDALLRVWDDVVLKNMYVTGGIGSSAKNEGFTVDYDLPNLEAYCETCASVGMILWNSRMNSLTGDAKYVDVLERSLYNGTLAGISLTGDKFFYVNPLESLGNHHRQAWYGCACCPSQICRFLPSIGNYIYGTSPDAVWVNLFIGSTAAVSEMMTLSQETDYPWKGAVNMKVGIKNRHILVNREIRVRIPGWCRNWILSVNGKRITPAIEKGYAVIKRGWRDGDQVLLDMDMPVEKVAADYHVKQNFGKRAICRGPLVYCMEEADNKENFDGLVLNRYSRFESAYDFSLLGGIVKIQALGSSQEINFIPYFAWDNREAGKMKVWVDYSGM